MAIFRFKNSWDIYMFLYVFWGADFKKVGPESGLCSVFELFLKNTNFHFFAILPNFDWNFYMRLKTAIYKAYTIRSVLTWSFEWYTLWSIKINYRGTKPKKQAKKVKNRENGNLKLLTLLKFLGVFICILRCWVQKCWSRVMILLRS